MAEEEEPVRTTVDREPDVWAAGQALARSLWRFGLTIVASPMWLLPEQTRRHLEAAGREAVLAGIVLDRELLHASDEILTAVRRRLDEMETKVSRPGEGDTTSSRQASP